MTKTFEGISLYQRIAEIDMKEKKIECFHYFGSCLKTIKYHRDSCLTHKCIIEKLVTALEKRGAEL